MKNERRSFLRFIPVTLVATAVARVPGAFAQAKAAAGATPRLDEKDATAKALGYVHDATKADKAKFTNWKPGETCAGCVQFKGQAKDAWGPCAIFANKQVNAKGWCSAWQKKT